VDALLESCGASGYNQMHRDRMIEVKSMKIENKSLIVLAKVLPTASATARFERRNHPTISCFFKTNPG
jgi:hypothetical protein